MILILILILGSASNDSEPQPSPQPPKSLDDPMFGNDDLELGIGVDDVDYLALDMGEEKEQIGIVSAIIGHVSS